MGRGRRSTFRKGVFATGLRLHYLRNGPDSYRNSFVYMLVYRRRYPGRQIESASERCTFKHAHTSRDQRRNGMASWLLIEVFRMGRPPIAVISGVNDLKYQSVRADIVTMRMERPTDDIETKEPDE